MIYLTIFEIQLRFSSTRTHRRYDIPYLYTKTTGKQRWHRYYQQISLMFSDKTPNYDNRLHSASISRSHCELTPPWSLHKPSRKPHPIWSIWTVANERSWQIASPFAMYSIRGMSYMVPLHPNFDTHTHTHTRGNKTEFTNLSRGCILTIELHNLAIRLERSWHKKTKRFPPPLGVGLWIEKGQVQRIGCIYYCISKYASLWLYCDYCICDVQCYSCRRWLKIHDTVL